MQIDFNNFYGSLITILIIIAVGFFIGKMKWINEDTNKQIVNLLLMIFMPVTLFNAFPTDYSEEYSHLFIAGLAGGTLVMFAMIIVARLVYHHKFLSPDLQNQAQFAFVFNNATFLGYPIISMAFGEQGIVPYCGFIIMFNLALFSYGVWLFERKLSAKFFFKVITNPNIIAVILGLVLFLQKIVLPTPISSAVNYLSGVTTPLSLICIGVMLSAAKLGAMSKRLKLIAIAAAQLVLAPLATFLLLTALQFPREVVVICTLIQALPTATSLGLFAEKYGKSRGVSDASELVIVSTLLSIVTLPIVAMLLF